MIDKKKQGRLNKQSGAKWEVKVRHDLEAKNWFVAKFQNNIDLEKDIMHSAKRKYNPFNKALTIGSGFPDFICWKWGDYDTKGMDKYVPYGYALKGVEAKSNGYLTKEEREKCRWLLKNKVFSQISIAKKKKEGRKVIPEYIDFEEKYCKDKGE